MQSERSKVVPRLPNAWSSRAKLGRVDGHQRRRKKEESSIFSIVISTHVYIRTFMVLLCSTVCSQNGLFGDDSACYADAGVDLRGERRKLKKALRCFLSFFILLTTKSPIVLR